MDPAQEQRLAGELRRGVVVLAVLGALRRPAYGYSLQQALAERGFPVEQGTLYPLLRRLDEQGMLESDWTVDEERPRKYYRLSGQGAAALAALTAEWGRLGRVLDGLLTPGAGPDGADGARPEPEGVTHDADRPLRRRDRAAPAAEPAG
jgi:DNA-binding PadR family transcriptional regulator